MNITSEAREKLLAPDVGLRVWRTSMSGNSNTFFSARVKSLAEALKIISLYNAYEDWLVMDKMLEDDIFMGSIEYYNKETNEWENAEELDGYDELSDEIWAAEVEAFENNMAIIGYEELESE